jgi:hypothetical protein
MEFDLLTYIKDACLGVYDIQYLCFIQLSTERNILR